MADYTAFYLNSMPPYWSPAGDTTAGLGEFHQRCLDTGSGGGFLYWWAVSTPDTAYPFTPPAGGPTRDVVILAEFNTGET
jgi:hypothetical protein